MKTNQSIIGVYVITNRDKKYVGSSKNVEHRINEHKSALKRGVHQNSLMQYDYNLNPSDFHFELIYIAKNIADAKQYEEQQIATNEYCYNISNNLLCDRAVKEEIRRKRDDIKALQIEQLMFSYGIDARTDAIYVLSLADVSYRMKVSESDFIRKFFPKVHLAPEYQITYGNYDICMMAFQNDFCVGIICGDGSDMIDMRQTEGYSY